MPIRFGFARHRRRLLEAELQRITEEISPLDVTAAYLTGDFAQGRDGPDTALELVLVHATDSPPVSRPDFFLSHLLPRVETRFTVYTPAEFRDMQGSDPGLLRTLASAKKVHGE